MDGDRGLTALLPSVQAFIGTPRKVLIGGQWVAAKSGQTFEVYNPATGQVIGAAAACEKADVDDAVKAARKAYQGIELNTKRLAVIGMGRIGAEFAKRAQSFNMTVVAYDPFLGEEKAQKMGVEKVELDDLLQRADFITLHVPFTDQTANILSAEALAKTKPGVRIINCARGGLIVEADLKVALESGFNSKTAFNAFFKKAEGNKLIAIIGDEVTLH